VNLVGIALTLVAVAAWSFDPGSEARRLDDKDARAPSVPARTTSKPTGARMVRVVLAEGRGAVEFELRGDWGEHQGHKLSGRISARDDGGSIRLSSGAWKLDAGP